ncbi:catalase family peroxidase [Alteromonas flava]|uniref:catalase family peroxidase n=1 Tax=Alteromonas flava TaxID=2048003 RepID=UPI000C290560|nr:catalase family peroxidase [Alteromonas flava]
MRYLSSAVIVAGAFALTPISNVNAEPSPNDFIELFEKLGGQHKGQRRAHANGVCAAATFTPNKALAERSTSALFSAETLPATVRFSMGSGNPSADQRANGARGMAIQINLPDGSKHHIVGNSTPVFAAKDPATFFGLLENLLPNPEGVVDYQKVGAYIATHPSTQPLAQWQQVTPPPYSYGTSKYFGLHAFYFVDGKGERQVFRWHTTPDAGERLLTTEEKQALPELFLSDHLQQQFNADGVSFTIHATLGQPEDTTIDPSQAWPADRETVEFGKITLNAVGGDACTPINFDPNVVSAGFATSDDPVLKMRSPAYAISFGKRLSGQ